MNELEQLLSRRLADAAQDAPEFAGLRRGAGMRSRRAGPWRLAVAGSVAAAVVAGVAALAWVTMAGPTQDNPGDAQCPSVLTYQGRTYVGQGDLVRVPRAGEPAGSGVLPAGCGESQRSIEVFSVAGVSSATAVGTDEGVWLAETVTSLPPELRALRQEVPCRGSGQHQVAGTWVSADGPQPEQDYVYSAPYVAVVKADQGDILPLDDWALLTVRLQVTKATVRGTDSGLIKATLGGDARLLATVHCSGSAFVVDSLDQLP